MKPLLPLLRDTVHLLQCLNLIQQNYMESDSYIAIVNSDLSLDFPLFRFNYTKQISSKNLFGRKFDYYLVDCSMAPFKNVTDIFSSQSFFSSASRFIFFCGDIKMETLRALERFKILNMIFFNTSSEEILTYFPFRKRMFQQFDISLEVVGRCNEMNTTSLFPEKIPKKWINTTLNIYHSFAPPYCMGIEGELGIELDVQMIILDRLRMRPNFTKINIPEVGKRRVIMNFLKDGYCDFMIGVSSPTSYFQFAMPYIYDDLRWYVPSAKQLSKWKYLLEVLSKVVWFSWIISSAFAIVSLYINDIFLYGECGLPNFLHKFCIFFRLFLEQSVNFRTKYLSEIILITIFIFGTFMMNLIYKSRFFYFLTATSFENDLTSLDDIMDEGLNIGFIDWHKQLFEENKRIVSYLQNHFQSCNLQANCTDQAARYRNLAVLRPTIKMNYWTKRYMDEKGRSLLKMIEFPVLDLFWVAAFFPGHPLFKSVNRYVLFLLDHGIMNKIMSKYSDGMDSRYNILKTRRLTISHVQVPIMIWITGMIIGTLIFTLEIKISYAKKVRKRRFETPFQRESTTL